MKRFAKFFGLMLAAVLWLGNVAAKKKSDSDDSGENTPKFNVPIPLNHNAKGVKLPYFDTHGKLQMNFDIELATRIDNDHLQMKRTKMETYGADGKPEMSINMTTSVLDLNTRVVTSNRPVTIHRSDFEITGETMIFDTATRAGKMVGKVRMLIFNRKEMTETNEK